MENISRASVQSDSPRDAVVETPASDSDSGDSLFLTQSVTALRNVKRHRPSNTQAYPFSQESEDEQEMAQHEDNVARSDSDSETSYTELLNRWRKLGRMHSIRCQPRTRRSRVPPKRMLLPFLKKTGSGKLSVRKNQIIVNSEIGGFFKCILKLSKAHKENRRELSPSRLPTEWEQNNMKENEDDDEEEEEDIRKVNTDCFIFSANKRNRETWLPFLKWKKKCTQKSKKCQEEREKSYQTRQVSEDLMEPQGGTHVYNESSWFHIDESQLRRMGEKSSKSPARSSLSPSSTPSCLSLFVQNLFMDLQEAHTENQPQVLVTDSQSQSLDLHQAQKINETCTKLMEPIDEVAVEETQWPSSEETQISEDNLMDRDGGHNVLCLENISSHELQGQNEDFREGIHHETVDNEDLGSVSGGFTSSQDLFQEPNNQASSLKEIGVENTNEKIFKNLLHNDTDSLMRKKRCSSILANMEGVYVKYSKSQRTQPSKIISTIDIDHERKKKNKKTSDDGVEHVYPSIPLEDYTTGSRGSDYSSPSKDIHKVRQDEKTESPLFKYGEIKLLKRKKGKAPEISDNLPQKQAVPDQNEDSVPHFDDVKQKKRKNVGLLEEPVDTLPEISVPTESSLSVQDCSVVCAPAGESKPKKKRNKDKNVGLFEEKVGTLQEISVSADPGLSVQDSSVVCALVGGSKPKKKRKKDKDVGLFEEPIESLQEISVSADLGLSVQDSSVVCASVGVSKPKKKRKKDKNVGLFEEKVSTLQEISVSADPGLSVQDSSVVCASDGGSKPKKKRKKDKNVVLFEEPVDTLPEISVPIELRLSVQDTSVVCASVIGIKPKKKSKKYETFELLEKPVESLQEISVSADLGLSVQDSSLVCASVSGSKLKKKRKKDKPCQPVPQEDQLTGVEEAIQIPSRGSDCLVSIAKETALLTGSDLSSPEVNQLDITALQGHVQCEGHRPRKKKKGETKKRDSSPVMSDEMVASMSSEDPQLSHGMKTVKKKKMAMASKSLGEPFEKILEIPACIEIQTGNNIDLMTNDTITPRKKKKRKRQEVVRQENMDVEASLVVTRELVETLDNFQDSEQQELEVVQVKKQKKKKDINVTHLENKVSKNGDASNTPNNSCETEGIDDCEFETVKKKKKKRRKELNTDGSWSISHGLEYLDNSHRLNNEQITVVKEASGSGQKLGKEHPALCLEMQLTNDKKEKKQHERTKSNDTESTQQLLEPEDTIQPNGKKKKKRKEKRWLETDTDV